MQTPRGWQHSWYEPSIASRAPAGTRTPTRVFGRRRLDHPVDRCWKCQGPRSEQPGPGLAVEGILRLRTTGTHPHAQWRMLRGRKHTRSVRRMTAFEGILRELSVNRLERTFGVQSAITAASSVSATLRRWLDTRASRWHSTSHVAGLLTFLAPPATPSFRAPRDRFRRQWSPRSTIEHA